MQRNHKGMMKKKKECDPGTNGLPIELYVNCIDEITWEWVKWLTKEKKKVKYSLCGKKRQTFLN